MASLFSGLFVAGVGLQEKEVKMEGRRKIERQIRAMLQISLGLFLRVVKTYSR